MYWKCEISINLIINIMVLWYFWTRDGGFHGRHSTSIDLFRSTANWTDVWTKDATRNEKESARVASAFARDLVLLPFLSALEKLVWPSLFYISRCARTTPSCGYRQLSRRDVSRPASYERLVRVRACVRACVREQMF